MERRRPISLAHLVIANSRNGFFILADQNAVGISCITSDRRIQMRLSAVVQDDRLSFSWVTWHRQESCTYAHTPLRISLLNFRWANRHSVLPSGILILFNHLLFINECFKVLLALVMLHVLHPMILQKGLFNLLDFLLVNLKVSQVRILLEDLQGDGYFMC